jgi:phosphoribosylformylglycinamidine synthase
MNKPRVLIVRTAGTNCDQETVHAFELAGAEVSLVHTNRLLSKPGLLAETQVFVIPGGFTYGDDIAAGRVLANELRAFLHDDIARHVRRGGLVLGVCNGFQVLVKTGLLPGFDGTEAVSEGDARIMRARQLVTLAFNDSNRFEDRWVYLKICSEKSEFINSNVEVVYLPVAHGEGKFVPLDESVLSRLEAQNQIVLRYCLPPRRGGATLENKVPYPHNPNGSIGDIAGICDPTGRILGLMPHPERYVHPTSHPRWTRDGMREPPDGLTFFLRAVDYVKKNLL